MFQGFPKRSVVLLLVLVAVTIVANTVFMDRASGRLVAWLVTLAAVVGVVGTIGQVLTGRPAGVIIDNRAKVSLSKFQMTLWMIVVVSSLVTIVASNLQFAGSPLPPEVMLKLGLDAGQAFDPLGIDIPVELLAALGISGFSLVAAPVILSSKADAPPTPKDVSKTATRLGMDETGLSNAGKVFGRSDPRDAAWADMFRGDEVGNAATVDLSKVQQFLITLLLVGAYCGFLVTALRGSLPIVKLPPLSEGFIWLMSISHASYLAFKAVPHTRTGDGEGSGDPRSSTDPRFRPVG